MRARTVRIAHGSSQQRYWRDLWQSRELIFILAWRDIAVRYKHTLIGFSWVLLRPFLTMLIFTFVFGYVAKLPAEAGVPYALMVFVGLLPWQFFAAAVGEIGNSLTANSALISKVYFPRMVLPLAAGLTALVDFIVSFILLAGLLVWYRFIPGWGSLALPLLVFVACLAALGPALMLAALTLRFRDFRFVTPFALQVGLYVSPVGFSSSVLDEPWRLFFYLNPMTGVIDGFRWALLGTSATPYVPGLMLSAGVSLCLLWLGLRLFRRMEQDFADIS